MTTRAHLPWYPPSRIIYSPYPVKNREFILPKTDAASRALILLRQYENFLSHNRRDVHHEGRSVNCMGQNACCAIWVSSSNRPPAELPSRHCDLVRGHKDSVWPVWADPSGIATTFGFPVRLSQ